MTDAAAMMPLASLLQSPVTASLIDAVIGVTLLECAVLCTYSVLSGRGLAPSEIASSLAAGLALMLAMSALAHGLGPWWIATLLLLAGVAHAADMARRWRLHGQGVDRTGLPGVSR